MKPEINEIRRRLKDLGATFETERSGYIPVRRRATAKILEYRTYDTTPILRRVRQDVIRNFVYKNIVSVKRFGIIRALLMKECIMYKDPDIRFRITPLYITNVTFHLLSGRITGEIASRFENNSVEGEEGHYEVWRWRACPTDPDLYEWKKIPESAMLRPEYRHICIEENTNATIADIRKSISEYVSKGSYIDVKATFETTGLGDFIWSLLQYFIRGSLTTRDGYDVTVYYRWKGQIQSISRHIDARVVLPVVGSVHWSLD